MNNASQSGPNVTEQYNAIQQEYMHHIRSCDQSYMITLAGVAALYSWLLARPSQSVHPLTDIVLWSIGPLFVFFSFLKQHGTTRRAQTLSELMEEMEKRTLNDQDALHKAREKCRWEKPVPFDALSVGKVKAWLLPRAWMLFWGGLFLASLTVLVLRCFKQI